MESDVDRHSPRLTDRVKEKAEEPPPPDEPAVNPALARIGFVGLIVTGDERAVLLRTPGGAIARVRPGQVLPDGRALFDQVKAAPTRDGDRLEVTLRFRGG